MIFFLHVNFVLSIILGRRLHIKNLHCNYIAIEYNSNQNSNFNRRFKITYDFRFVHSNGSGEGRNRGIKLQI